MTKWITSIIAIIMAVFTFLYTSIIHKPEPVDPEPTTSTTDYSQTTGTTEPGTIPTIEPGKTATTISKYTDANGDTAFVPAHFQAVFLILLCGL